MERRTLNLVAGVVAALGALACSDNASTMNPTIPGSAGTAAAAGTDAVAGMTAPNPTAGGMATADTGTTAGTGTGSAGTTSSATAGTGGGTGTAGTSAGTGGQPAAGAGAGGSGGAAGGGASDVGTDALPPLADSVALPLVFVHGFAGSAQQYQSQKMRFVANGYPADRIVAYEHNGDGFDTAGFAAGLGAIVDQVMMKFGTSKVYLAAHSRGGGVVGAYLDNAQNAAKVAKYVALDAIGACSVPSGVSCLSLTQAGLSQKHVEVSTSAESFKQQYKHFVGEDPKVVDIVRQKGMSTISGRAQNFPANTGRTGATVKVWEVDGNTGARVGTSALATFMIADDGNWGPAMVDPDKFYELELINTEGGAAQHFYGQRFLRSTDFVRLLTGGPDSDSSMNTNKSDKHVALLVSRQREWTMTDVLEITTMTPSGNSEPVNVINSAAAGRNAIAIHLHDAAASPGDSTLSPLPYFSTASFQYGMDVFIPAADPPTGTIVVKNIPRGDAARPQIIRAANWPSSSHRVTVSFSDFAQD
jgi:pimeloyl-ACP methyl ester carboxylesterase